MTTEDPNEEDRLDPNTISLGCRSCPEFGPCGGYTRAGGGWDCMDECGKECDPRTCTLVCMRNPDRYALAMTEIGGSFGSEHLPRLEIPTVPLPRYVPVLQHKYIGAVRLPWAAIPLTEILKCRGRGYEVAFRDGEDLRAQFGLLQDAKIVVLGIGEDPGLERFWERYLDPGVLEDLAALAIDVLVLPNFSYFHQDPRTHHLYNRSRSLWSGAHLSRAGIRVVPYFHAIAGTDCAFWAKLLRRQEHVDTIAQEFQTGKKRPDRAEKCLDELARLQDDLARPLHLVAVGGRQFARLIADRFDKWTILSSGPFIAAMNRHVYEIRGGCISERPSPGEDPAILVQANVMVVRRVLDEVRSQASAGSPTRRTEARGVSRPTATATARTTGSRAVRLPIFSDKHPLDSGSDDRRAR